MTRRVDIRGRCGGGGLGRQASHWAWLAASGIPPSSMWLEDITGPGRYELLVVPCLAFTYHIGAVGTDGSWNDWVASYASDNRDTPAAGPTITNRLGAVARASDVTTGGALNGVQLTPS